MFFLRLILKRILSGIKLNTKFIKTTNPKQKPDASTVAFGKNFTDHMFIMDYNKEKGWHDARIVPFDN